MYKNLNSNNSQLFNQIHLKILQDNPKVKISANNEFIRFIKCPVCNENEAWAHYDKPLAIICQRGNSCYAITSIKEVYPELFKNFSKYYPTTITNQNATATAYLESRCLDISKFSYGQGSILDKETNKTYPSVEIKIDNEITFHRLIDYSGKNKTRIFGSYSGKVWKPETLDYSKPIWIVEGIIDALSLIQSGIQTIATLSSAHLPSAFYESIKCYNPNFIIAFDNDEAGWRAIDKHIKYFKEQNIKYEIALPTSNNDWNDLLVKQAFDNERKNKTIKDSLWRGRLHCAETIQEYHRVYSERNITNGINNYLGILEWHDCYYYITDTKQEGLNIKKISDFTMKILFSIKDESIEYNTDIENVCEIKNNNQIERTNFNATDLSQNTDLKKKVMRSARVHWEGTQNSCNALIKTLLKDNPPVIRKAKALGYDPKSDCYLFGDFLYDSEGKRHNVNALGYFEKQKVLSLKEKDDDGGCSIINSYETIDIPDLLETIVKIYGMKAWMVVGYYISTLFAHLIYNNNSSVISFFKK